MATPDLPSDRLSSSLQDAFAEAIYDLFGQHTVVRPDRPVAVLVAGQSGAGKSNVRAQAIADLSATGTVVVIDPDDIRRFHPKYEDLMRADHRSAPRLLAEDVSALTDVVIDHAQSIGCHVVIDRPFSVPEHTEQRIARLHDAGYTVDVQVLAVPHDVSRAATILRYERQLASDAPARLVPEEVHASTYEGVASTVAALEASRSPDRLSVRGRDGAVLCETSSQDPQPAQRSATAAMQLGRESLSQPAVMAEHRRAVAEIQHLQSERAAPESDRTPALLLFAQAYGLAREADRAEHNHLREAGFSPNDLPRSPPPPSPVDQSPNAAAPDTPTPGTNAEDPAAGHQARSHPAQPGDDAERPTDEPNPTPSHEAPEQPQATGPQQAEPTRAKGPTQPGDQRPARARGRTRAQDAGGPLRSPRVRRREDDQRDRPLRRPPNPGPDRGPDRGPSR